MPSFRKCLVGSALLLAALQPLAGQGARQETTLEQESLLRDMDLLMQAKIVSASNTPEPLGQAPATVLVLTQEDIVQRGYTDLSELLDDLPGFDVIRPFGDAYVKAYARGYRNTWGDPFLVLVDGVPSNYLWYNTSDVVLVPFPLSLVSRVEVVYGPASSVYGANAMMGVINIRTRIGASTGESQQIGGITAGSRGRRGLDYTFLYGQGGVLMSLSARLDNGHEDDETSQAYEYTKRKYAQDPRLWGGFLADPKLAGDTRSEFRNRGFNLRLAWGDTELGLTHSELTSGYGNEYAADLAQPRGLWSRPATGLHLLHAMTLAENLKASTLIRYRRNDVSNDSYFVDAYFDASQKSYLAAFSWWQILNSSWSFAQDVDWRPGARFGMNAGLRYEQKDLQKGLQSFYGPYIPAGQLLLSSYPFPAQPLDSRGGLNRVLTEEEGAYLQARLALSETHRFNLGVRLDHHSEYGSATSIRAGYVGSFAPWTVKLLYGQAYQEPTPRTLYGGWVPGGSNPELKPERSTTYEGSVGITSKNLALDLNPFHVRNTNTIVTGGQGAKNLGERKITGADVHFQALLPPGPFSRWKVWGYYSRIFSVRELKVDPISGLPDREGTIGDLALNKLWAGSTLEFSQHLDATLRARWMASRRTVETNPIPRVPGFATFDLNINFRLGGAGLSLRVANLTDKLYFHPGFADGNAGDRPGSFNAQGEWEGSGGYYSSLLAQPGRAVYLTLRVNK